MIFDPQVIGHVKRFYPTQNSGSGIAFFLGVVGVDVIVHIENDFAHLVNLGLGLL